MPDYKLECPDCVHFKDEAYLCFVHTEGWLPGRTNYAMDCDDYLMSKSKKTLEARIKELEQRVAKLESWKRRQGMRF